ncbi:DUF1847 domain-containing protein [Methanococcoides sp. SA1]|nr:DUF1847 domain-containing protein [Methanococcoides sp. SA1]
MKCSDCDSKDCYRGKNCAPKDILADYKGEDLKIMKVASGIEAKYYMQKTRLEEIILFTKEFGYEKVGVAFCIGLEKEAKIFCEILEKHITVESVCCKVCGVEKDTYDLDKMQEENIEVSCNPIAQANILNRAGTQLNIAIGLCLGHDMLFNKHSEAPVTTFIVKDRVLAHNPAGALYSKYYMKNVFEMGKE